MIDRTAWSMELYSGDPDDYDDVDFDVGQGAIGVAVTNHDESLTLLCEVSTDEEGNGTITAAVVAADGTAVAPTVLDAGTSIMLVARPPR